MRKSNLGSLQKALAGTVMASVGWDSQGMIKNDYFELGKTVTGNTSVQQIKIHAKQSRPNGVTR